MATLKNTSINSTESITLPVGTSAQRPGSPSLGMMRYNTDESYVEVYDGTEWFPIASGGAADPSDLSTINAEDNMIDIAYAQIPGGPRTVLNYVQSFGLDENSQNDGGSTWTNGFDVVSFEFIDTGNYFLSGFWRLFSGDGSSDGGDWVLWNFGQTGGGDFNPNLTVSGYAFFGGEFQNQSGATNGGIANRGYIWGFDESNWIKLWEEPLGEGGNWQAKS